MVDAEKLVDLPDLERRGELLAQAEKIALGKRSRADESREGAVGGALGRDTAASGEAA